MPAVQMLGFITVTCCGLPILEQDLQTDMVVVSERALLPVLGNPMDRGAWWATVHGVAEDSDMTLQLSSNNNRKLD